MKPLLLLLLIGPALCAAPAAVHFDRTQYSFEDNGVELSLATPTGVRRFALTACNREVWKPVRQKWAAVRKADALAAARSPTPYDVHVDERAFARGSWQGTWLRALPTHLLYVDLEAKRRCENGR